MTRRVLIPLDLDPPALPAGGRVHELGGETMGTTWSVKLVADAPPPDLPGGIKRILDRVIAQMSTWELDSDLSRFNAAPAGTWHRLPDDLFTVLAHAVAMAEDSGGAFDPSIGPLVALWGFGPGENRAIPDPVDLAETAARCGWQRLVLDPGGRRAFQPGGLHVDLSGIAKGHAVDLVARHIQDAGIPNHLVEIGGELRGYGVKPDGSPWWMALETPAGIASETIVALHGMSAATSGDYRRFFMDGETRYSHTIDPRTGRPVASEIASVTVLHRACMHADALATALGVLGAEHGLAWARKRHIAARFLSRDGDGFRERTTPAFDAMLD